MWSIWNNSFLNCGWRWKWRMIIAVNFPIYCDDHSSVLYVQCTCILSGSISVRLEFMEWFIIYILRNTRQKAMSLIFRTQLSSSQSEERTMVFTREKTDTSNQNRERCFFTREKNDTSNQKSQRCVSFAPKFPPFIAGACTLQRPRFASASLTFN